MLNSKLKGPEGGQAVALRPLPAAELFPLAPGVYIFRDKTGTPIYVGKAKSLRKRLQSYFKPPAELAYKTARMLRRAQSIEFILTSTEKEAFILESNLIKEHLPRYNIILRDDKQYPCLRLDPGEDYPRLRIVRRIKKDGALYFGPFSSAKSVRQTLRVIDRVFQLRKCKPGQWRPGGRPCLNHQLQRCLGPCTLPVDRNDYRKVVQQVRLFLEGRNKELLVGLRREMEEAAGRLDFERAARLRDQIKAVERTVERQKVVSPRLEDRDVIALAHEENRCQVVVLHVRQGYLLGSRSYRFHDAAGSAGEMLEGFLSQYYQHESFIPPEILISEPLEDADGVASWLSETAGRKVRVKWPQRGEKRRLVEMAFNNARELLSRETRPDEGAILGQLQELLGLQRRPRRMEALDISNLQGGEAVGAVACFLEGRPHKHAYRNYRMRGFQGADDYAMMAELARRRLAHGDWPDLLVVDGGRGQLNAVGRVLIEMAGQIADLGHDFLPEVVALAKPDPQRGETSEKIYLPGRKNALRLAAEHPALHLLMHLRDEAHRRAVGYHSKLRGRKALTSVLDQIPGIGPRRRKLLLEHFGDLGAVSEADLEALMAVPGLGRRAAEATAAFFTNRFPESGKSTS